VADIFVRFEPNFDVLDRFLWQSRILNFAEICRVEGELITWRTDGRLHRQAWQRYWALFASARTRFKKKGVEFLVRVFVAVVFQQSGWQVRSQTTACYAALMATYFNNDSSGWEPRQVVQIRRRCGHSYVLNVGIF